MDRRSRGTLGCSMMLFTPILLTGVGILANTSRDMETNVDVFWMYVLAATGVVTFLGGGMIWWRNR